MKRHQKIPLALLIITLLISLLSVQAFASSTMSAPTNLQSESVTADSATLTWDAVPGATGYIVVEVGVQCFTVDSSVTSYTVTGLNPDSAYTFKVMALNGSVNSEWSAPVYVTTAR